MQFDVKEFAVFFVVILLSFGVVDIVTPLFGLSGSANFWVQIFLWFVFALIAYLVLLKIKARPV